MSKVLGYIQLIGLIIFFILLGQLDSPDRTEELAENLFWQLIFATMIICVLGPWVYALVKSHKEVDIKWFKWCFLLWPITPYYLIKVRGNK